jgi:dTDP-glucose 4,6-dehydratase
MSISYMEKPDRPYQNGKIRSLPMTMLITGGAGFIGSNFVRRVWERYPDYRIIVLDLLTYAGNVMNFTDEMRESDRFEFIYGSVCNGAQVADIMSRVDLVVHFAAETHVTRSIYDSTTFFETDVLGTAALASAAVQNAARIRRFVHVSTSEVYGTCRSDHDKMDEEHPLEPCSPYASAKAGADRLIYSYWRTHDLPAVIVRPFNNYGPRQHLEKCIARFVTSALMGEPLTVHGTGFSSRDWIYVDDTCEAIDALVHAPASDAVGEVFNLGTETSTDVLALAHMILEKTGRSKDLIKWVGDRPGQVEKHRADASKIRRVLGWTPDVDISAGLDRTIAWYADNEPFWRPQLWMRKIKIATAKGREWH